ncbi:hypothetical protein SAMN05444004_102233 [Jannaschia faecimaris]|uniref:Uncharacterized protein n=1 Tax=Jannaschia faecimaris TaxID=1244108 RepID=A0A1H3LKH6_9RHOB|nr:hypothetical protein [Jannaschia faecimaris]SDY64800.1 hypothetical protein SAMN05444004_102233 [Jannaschia faecimaris]
MREDSQFERVQDYTNAFLGMFYLILVMTLVIIWGVWGYPVSLAICAVMHWGIRRWGQFRAAREAAWEARVQAALARRRD